MTEKPTNPYAILAASLILPGSGHVWLGNAPRGLMFLFFTIVLGWVSARLMPDHVTFIGRYIGGIFIYGLSALDAYKIARIRWETWHYERNNPDRRSPAAGPAGTGGGKADDGTRD
jgi:hypothetical protein